MPSRSKSSDTSSSILKSGDISFGDFRLLSFLLGFIGELFSSFLFYIKEPARDELFVSENSD